MPEPLIFDGVIARLSVHLGVNVARMSLKSFAKKEGIAGPEQLTIEHIPRLIAEIRPMLNIMIGKGPSESVLGEIARLAI